MNCTKKCVWPLGSARTRWGAIALPKPPSRYEGEGREEREKVLGIVERGGMGRVGREGVGKEEKRKEEMGREGE